MTLGTSPTPDKPRVQAVTFGPVVLSGGLRRRNPARRCPGWTRPRSRRPRARPLEFSAAASGRTVQLIPVARMHHQHYNVYWIT